MQKLDVRASTTTELRMSAGLRAQHHNTYMVSLTPYPAQMGLPGRKETAALRKEARKAVPCGWMPWRGLPGFGVGGCGLKGAPRCPVAAATAHAIIGMLHRGLWGPAELIAGVERAWAAVVSWASRDPGLDPLKRLGMRGHHIAARKIIALQRQRANGELADVSNAGAHIYAAVWATNNRAWFHQFLIRCSSRRKWLTTEGKEWRILAHCRAFDTAHLVAKI